MNSLACTASTLATLTLTRHVENYLVFALTVRHFTHASVRDIRCTLLSFVRHCDSLKIYDPRQITPQTTLSWIKWERGRNPFGVGSPVKDSTLKKDYAHLKGFFAYLVSAGVLEKDPSAFLKVTRRRGVKALNVLTVEQTNRLLDATDPDTPLGLRDRVVVGLLWIYGLRCSELIALDVADLDFENKTLTVRKGKGSKPRVLPLMPGVVDRLQQLIRQRWRETQSVRHDIPLLVTSAGQRLSQQGVNQILRKYAHQAEIPGKVTALTLRHCFATHLALNGVDVAVIARLMGVVSQ